MNKEIVFLDEADDTTDEMFDFQSNLIEVAPGIFQSLADYQANQEYDEMIDNELVPYQLANEEPNDNPVY